MERTVICPDCHAEFSEHARYCTTCGKPRSATLAELRRLATATERDLEELLDLDRAGKPLPLYPAQARRRILQQVIHRMSDNGWQIVSQTDTTAQLRRPKQFGCLEAALTPVFGLGILLYLMSGEPRVYIEVDELGQINATGHVDPRTTALVRHMNQVS